MAYTDDQIYGTLQSFFAQGELARAGGAVIEPDTDIIADGAIDSLGIFKLIAFVEEKFNVMIEPQEVLLENFQTLHALRDLIVKKIA